MNAPARFDTHPPVLMNKPDCWHFCEAAISAEQSLLGAILINQEALDIIDGGISTEDFCNPVHQEIFRCLQQQHASGRRIDVKLLSGALGHLAGASVVGQLTVDQYLARLASEAVSVICAPDYARTVRDYADKRRLIEIAETIKAIACGEQSADAIAVDAIEALDAIACSRLPKYASRVTYGEAASEAVNRINAALQNPGQVTGITWGLRSLDTETNGVERGDLVIVAGRPGMGKTAFAVSISRLMATAGYRVLLFSLEMMASALASRALTDAAFDSRDVVAYSAALKGLISDDQAERLIELNATQSGFRCSLSSRADCQFLKYRRGLGS